MKAMVECARGRRKIVNEGFNNQKKGLYRIEHLNRHNLNAMKNYYLLIQIADILMQLYLSGHKLLTELKQRGKNYILRTTENFSPNHSK